MAEWWTDLWRGMPEFVQESMEPKRTLTLRLRSPEDEAAFEALVGQEVQNATRYTPIMWYPEAEIGRFADKRWVGGPNPIYPVYVISKGRYDSNLTARALEAMGVPYHLVVEPQEHDAYAAKIDPAKILTLPFSNLGQGSIPARNWVWEHALASGAKRHWIMDDNIRGFYRLNRNLKVPALTGAIFRAMEAFSDRFSNVAISGPHYFMFASRKAKAAPMTLNTRVYSCILIRNDLPFRWRGRYNEDTDLCLRALKVPYATILFQAFLAMKTTTMRMKGGNTDELYKDDGRLKMAQSLLKQHPDVTKIMQKWGRWQHVVDYRPFEGIPLLPVEGLEVPEGVDEFGMGLRVSDTVVDDPAAYLPGEEAPPKQAEGLAALRTEDA